MRVVGFYTRGGFLMQLEAKPKMRNLKLIIIIVSSIIVICLAVLAGVYAVNSSKLNNNKIYDGIYAGGENVGGLTVEEAAEKIESIVSIDEDRVLTLSCDGKETSFVLGEAGVKVDAFKTAEMAYDAGRNGTRKERLNKIADIKKNELHIDINFTYENDLVFLKINEIANQVDVPERELAIEIVENEIVATKGEDGERIIEENAIKLVEKAILDGDSDIVMLKKEQVKAPELTVDYLKKEICSEPKNATYEIVENRLNITPEKTGVKIDMATAERILKEASGNVVRIPAEIIQPEITAAKIEADLFPDLLGSYRTKYNAGDVSRSHNVALASSKISGTILDAGEVFSYNDIVGPRTAARGFKEAGVYVGNKVERGLGGGICQVSSTLFNAVVLSDLKIVYRTNHSLPVSYVPLGRDATVSYGSIDFKFSNNTDGPIKIVASASGGVNEVRIYGVKKHPGRTVEMQTECTGTYAPKTEIIEDPTLPVGEIEVEQKGANGSSHITYKITKENGKIIKTETLTKSKYSAQDRIERVGTLEEVPTEAPSGEETGDNINHNQGENEKQNEDDDENEPLPSVAPAPAPEIEDGGQQIEE